MRMLNLLTKFSTLPTDEMKLIQYLQNYHKLSHVRSKYAFRDVHRTNPSQLRARVVKILSYSRFDPLDYTAWSYIAMDYMDSQGVVRDLAHTIAVEMHDLLTHNVYFDLCDGNLTVFCEDTLIKNKEE